jgi:thioester reductase-like protein
MTVAELVAKSALDPDIAARCGRAPHAVAEPAAVLLTGATGFLGAFLLDELLRQSNAQIHCLVRARDAAEGMRRIRANLRSYLLDDEQLERRVTAVPGDLSRPLLGLGSARFAALAERVDSIYHCGAAVKWTYPYAALEPANVLGTREILRLATTAAPRPVHFISTVGVFSSAEFAATTVAETEPLESSGPLSVGYAQTKWVAERMVRTAGEHGLPVSIYRPSIGADSRTGAFNPHDHLCLTLAGAIKLRCAPDCEMPVQIAPVDFVARATVHLSLREQPGTTVHLVNHRAVTWTALFDTVNAVGYPLARLPLAAWKALLMQQTRSGSDNPLLGLLPFLVDALDTCWLPTFADARSRAALTPAGIDCPAIDAALLRTYLGRFVTTGWAAPAHAARAEAERVAARRVTAIPAGYGR